MGKKALRSVYLDMQQVERLKLLSEKTRVPQAVYIREGLDLVMSKYEKKIRAIPPAGKSRVRKAKSLTPHKR
jgi:predicted DNA-binding protein